MWNSVAVLISVSSDFLKNYIYTIVFKNLKDLYVLSPEMPSVPISIRGLWQVFILFFFKL